MNHFDPSLKARPSARTPIRLALLAGALLAISAGRASSASIVLSSFDTGAHTISSGGTYWETYVAAPGEPDDQRKMLVINASNSINQTVPGSWTISGSRGDVGWGNTNAEMPALNFDATGMTQWEFDVVGFSGGAAVAQLQFMTNTESGSARFDWYPVSLGSTGTIVVPFNTNSYGPAGGPTAPNLADIDQIYVRIDMDGGGSIEISEIRLTDGATPEPGTALLGLLGLSVLLRRRR